MLKEQENELSQQTCGTILTISQACMKNNNKYYFKDQALKPSAPSSFEEKKTAAHKC
jgi:hypothetical protein